MPPGVLSTAEVQAKTQQYEAFANDVLKRDLQRVTEQRGRYQVELDELEELQRSIQQLQQVGRTTCLLHAGGTIQVISHAHDLR